jgi:hypothetical protein
MSGKILFSEQQKFQRPWMWLLILVVFAIPAPFFWGIIQQMVQGSPFGDPPMSDMWLIISFCLSLLLAIAIIVFVIKIRLETVITLEGIKVKYFPFHRSFRTYKWEEIAKASVRKYNPFMEFGGRGMRMRRRKRGYMMSGNRCLELVLMSGCTLIIGTQKEYELKRALQRMEQMDKNNQSKIE